MATTTSVCHVNAGNEIWFFKLDTRFRDFLREQFLTLTVVKLCSISCFDQLWNSLHVDCHGRKCLYWCTKIRFDRMNCIRRLDEQPEKIWQRLFLTVRSKNYLVDKNCY
jgi:hypothetical protein